MPCPILSWFILMAIFVSLLRLPFAFAISTKVPTEDSLEHFTPSRRSSSRHDRDTRNVNLNDNKSTQLASQMNESPQEADVVTMRMPPINAPITPPRGSPAQPHSPTKSNGESDASELYGDVNKRPTQGQRLTSNTGHMLPRTLDFSTTQWLYNMTHFAALAYGSNISSNRLLSCQQSRTSQSQHENSNQPSTLDFISTLTMIQLFDQMIPLTPSSLFFANEPSDYIAQCKLYRAFSCGSSSRQGFIAVHAEQKQILIVFRGSVNVANYIDNLIFYKVELDWATLWIKNQGKSDSPSSNSDSKKTPLSLPLVHSGYLNAYMEIRHQFRQALIDLLANRQYASYSLLFIGHSLGGVLSIFAALDYAIHLRMKQRVESSSVERNVQVVTIGCPRIGDPTFAQFYHSQLPGPNTTLRVVMDSDPVPHFLFSSRLGFAHVGREVWIRRNQHDKVLTPELEDDLDAHTTLLCRIDLEPGMEDSNCSASLSSINLQPLDHLSIWNISVVDYLLKC